MGTLHNKLLNPGIERITLCGSTKYKPEYLEWNARLTLAGYVVYSVAFFGHVDVVLTAAQKERVDAIHLAKIDNSDAIFVLNLEGYIGSSTQAEIDYAQATGKTVFYYSDEAPGWQGDFIAFKNPDEGIMISFQNFVREHMMAPDDPLFYTTAFGGEVGEMLNIQKKLKMVEMHPEWVDHTGGAALPDLPTREELESKRIDELGDSLFYLVAVAIFGPVSIIDIINRQMAKVREQGAILGRKFLK